MQIKLDEVQIDERVRDDKGTDTEWRDFVLSICTHGQLQPIVVSSEDSSPVKFTLVAGGRRCAALKEIYDGGGSVPRLETGFIEAVRFDALPAHTRLLIEGEENLKRKDFNMMERAKFIRKFHETMKAVSENWTPELTGLSLGMSASSSIREYLRIEEASRTNESIAKAETIRAARKRMRVIDEHKTRIERAKSEATDALTRAEAILVRDDARAWITKISAESVDFVNFDPPWGNDASRKSAENHEGFDDSDDYSTALSDGLLPELYRVLKPNRYMAFWFRNWASAEAASTLERHGFTLKWTRTPCIWFKPDKNNDQNRYPEKQLNEAYETFYLAAKGEPVFYERETQNVFSVERVTRGNLVHPTEKPTQLMDRLIRLCTVPGETVLDPTAGSASTLVSALGINRRAKGCELSRQYHQFGISRLTEILKTFKEI